MNARESENYLAISRSTSASKSVEIFWTGICRRRLFFRAESSLIQSNCRSLGTDHLTWRGGVMVFCFVQNFFLGQHESDYYFFLSHKVQFFFPEFHIGYMTKTLNQIIFFPLPKSEYFFRKKNITPQQFHQYQQNVNNHLSSQIIEHRKDLSLWGWPRTNKTGFGQVKIMKEFVWINRNLFLIWLSAK